MDKRLSQHLDFNNKQLSNLVKKLDVEEAFKDIGFYYISLKNGEPREDQFLEYLTEKLIYRYCNSAKEVAEAERLFSQSGDASKMFKLATSGKKKFIAASKYKAGYKVKKANSQDGEVGELILYAILDHFEKAPKVLSKMPLKTDQNMPVHGTDGIHMKFCNKTKKLKLLWCESKVYSKFSTGLSEAFKSIKELEVIKEEKEHEFDLLQRHIELDAYEESLQEEVLKYLDPYSEENSDLQEVHVCFVAFSWDKYEEIYNKHGTASLNEHLENELKGFAREQLRLLKKRFSRKAYKWAEKCEFIFVFLPVRNAENLRKEFKKKLENV